jgi:hypothetical protein
MGNRYLVYLVIFGVFIVFLVGYNLIDTASEHITSFGHKHEAFPRGYKFIGVLDFDANNTIDKSSIANGTDAALVINPQWSQAVSSNLVDFDSNNDGYIDVIDPIYGYLELIFMDDYHHVSLAVAGIRAIRLDPATPGIYEAIFSDGSKRLIRTNSEK